MSGKLSAPLMGKSDRLEIPHLREALEDSADGSTVGVLIFWKTEDDTGKVHFINSIFGELLESDVAYMSVLLGNLAIRRGPL